MIYYYQRDNRWAKHIYSAVSPHTETVQSSGCGPTSAAMIVSNLAGTVVTPDQMADYSASHGYRIDGVGTSFALFPAIAKEYDLEYRQASRMTDALDCVRQGGLAVCSTDGAPQGLFSTGGHLFVMCGDGEFLDPDAYPGKYDVSYRRNKANVKGNIVKVASEVAAKEISTYFLFWRKAEEDMAKIDDLQNQINELHKRISDLETPMIYNYIDNNVPDWARATVQKLVDKGCLKGNEKGELGMTDEMLKIFVVLDRAGLFQ